MAVNEREMNEKIKTIALRLRFGLGAITDHAVIEKFEKCINPAYMGELMLSTQNGESLEGYRSFWKEIGSLSGYQFSNDELDHLSTHPIEVFNFMSGAGFKDCLKAYNFYD